jgi:SIR2-like domain
MSKITYLLGAGASCNALPLVNNFKDRLKSFFNKNIWEDLQIRFQIEKTSAHELFPYNGQYGKDFMESISWLINVADKHASIDTYAKKLFVRNDNDALKELNKLKSTLSCYFLLEQSLKPVDKRYDNFFASILTPVAGIPKLPKDVNIITWNYDTQLEKSYEGFCSNLEIAFEKFLQSKNIIRLNGSCGFPYAIETKYLGYTEFSIDFLESVIQLYDKFMNPLEPKFRPGISFAWGKKDIEDKVKQELQGTTTLVIIGYSLPYFNREIDQMIINAMRPTLVKIFIQVQEKEYQGHKERFLTLYDNITMKKIMKGNINKISGTDLFYIPDDMPR